MRNMTFLVHKWYIFNVLQFPREYMNINSCLRQMWFWRCPSPEFAFASLWLIIAIEVAPDFFYLLFPLIRAMFWRTAAPSSCNWVCYVLSQEGPFLYFANECWTLGCCRYLIKVALKLFQMARIFNLRCTYTPYSSYIKDCYFYTEEFYCCVLWQLV